MCIEAQKLGIKKLILPRENMSEASIVKDIEIFPAKTLLDVIYHLNGENLIEKAISRNAIFSDNSYQDIFDFADVKGQENVKRALEISAAGGHNCLLIGSPGSRENNVSKEIAKHITRSNI